MKKHEFERKLFSIVFLFIFFLKMVISIAPLIAEQIDSEVVNAVIMQLEIESHSSKGADQAKETLTKGEWLSGFNKFTFSRPLINLELIRYAQFRDLPIRAFYPSVPTPPPNS